MTVEPALSVIRLEGELDISRRNEIKSALQLNGSEAGILIDLATATYADSTTLAELLRFRSEAERARIPLAVVIGSKQFARLIQYAGLGHVFKIFEQRGLALTYLANARAGMQ